MKIINHTVYITPYELQIINDCPDLCYIDHHSFGNAIRLIKRPSGFGTFRIGKDGTIESFIWGIDHYYKNRWIVDENS